MFYLTTTPSFSFRSIFLKNHRQEPSLLKASQNEQQVAEEEQNYYAGFPPNIIAEVERNFPNLQDKLMAARIRLATVVPQQHSNKHPPEDEIRMVRFDRGAAVVTYQVTIGRMVVEVVMLNVAHKASAEHRRRIQKGSFGEILEASYEKSTFVHKRVYFRSRQRILSVARDKMHWEIKAAHTDILSAVKEYALMKICAVLGIGPQDPLESSFDLVCYEDAIQFSMEKCEQLADCMTNVRELEERMLYCLRVLHSFGIIHKDVKPSNMVYSPALQNFVFIDFGISMWVKERPGEQTKTFREGTFQYMSPQMKRLDPGCAGWVDLYWNDLYALRMSLQKLDQMTLRSRQIPTFPYQPPAFEDALFPALWRHFAKGEVLPHSLVQRDEYKSMNICALMSYFPGQPKLDSEKQGCSDGASINIEFLIRAIGVSVELIRFLEPVAYCQERYRKLLIKLESRIQFCLQTRQMGNRTIPHNKLIQEYRRLLLKHQSNSDTSPEAILEQAAVLFNIANILFILDQSEEECASILRKIEQLEWKFRRRQPWAGYVRWLASLLENPNEIPTNTPDLFEAPLLSRYKHLLIGCIMARYTAGFVRTAAQLCTYLSGKCINLKIETFDDCRKSVIQAMELVMETFPVDSKEWLAVANFVWHCLIQMGANDVIIARYARIAPSLAGEARSELLCDLAFAYRSQSDLKSALSCCQQSLAIRKSLQTLKRETFIQQNILLVELYQGLGKFQSAISAAKEGIAMTQSLEERILFEQVHFRCLAEASRLKEALQLFEQLKDSIAECTQRLPFFCELMIKHLKIVRVVLTWRRGDKAMASYIEALAKRIFETLDKREDVPIDQQVFRTKAELLLTLSTVKMSCEPTKDTVDTLNRVLSCVASYAAQSVFQKVLTQQERQRECKALRENLKHPGHSDILEFVYNNGLLVYLYAAELARLFVLAEWKQMVSLIRWCRDFETVGNAVCQREPIKNILVFISHQLNLNGHFEVSLELLSSHEIVSRQDKHYTKASLLLKTGRIEESKQLFENIVIKNGFSYDIVSKSHENLASIYEMKVCLNPQLSNHHNGLALRTLLEQDALSPNKDLWARIGLCYIRLGNNKEALVWLQRLRRLSEWDQGPIVRTGLVAYAVCLNRLGRYRQSLYQLRETLTLVTAQSQRIECVFYLAHNCYVLRRRRLFTKYLALLFAMDRSEQHSQSFKEYLHKKGNLELLRIIKMATSQAVNTDNVSKATEAIQSLLEGHLVFKKKLAYFEGTYRRKCELMKIDSA